MPWMPLLQYRNGFGGIFRKQGWEGVLAHPLAGKKHARAPQERDPTRVHSALEPQHILVYSQGRFIQVTQVVGTDHPL